MPLRIDEMTTSIEIHEDERVRRAIREEVERVLRERDRRGSPLRRRDPADPSSGVVEED